MSSVVEDLVRLAWQADAGGRAGARDALLSLAVADGGAEDPVLAERCRRLLAAHRPDHWFAVSATLGHALTRPKVADALATLRLMYPPVRVRHLLLRGDAARGPYTGRVSSLSRILHDLTPTPGARRRADGRRRPSVASTALPFAGVAARAGTGLERGRDENPDPDGSIAIFYLSVLLAIAVLVNSVLRPSTTDTRAA
jgi:hypothetical protein